MIEQILFHMIELIVDIIESTLYIIFIGIFIAKGHIRENWKKIISFGIVIGVGVSICDQISLISAVKTVIIMGVIYIASVSIYKCKLRDGLIWLITCLAVFTVYQLFLLYLLQNITNINMQEYTAYSSARAGYIIINIITEVLLVNGLYYIVNKKKIEVENKFLLIIIPGYFVLTILIWILFLSDMSNNYAELMRLIYCLLTLALIIVLMVLAYISAERNNHQKELEITQIKNQILEKNLQEIKTAYTHWEKSIHDYKNIILGLNSMLEQSNQDSIKDFLDEEMQQIKQLQHMVNCGNTMLNSIISVKWSEAELLGIHVSVQGALHELYNVSEIDFGRMVGNMLDNAIEGAAADPQNMKYIDIMISEHNQLIVIIIKNSVNVSKIDFKKTSKKDGNTHGIGIQSIEVLAKKYGGTFFIEQKDSFVEARLIIPTNTK